jgi:regulator of protease activity HflC (stomatin/prohibitin superfamily)
MHNLWVELRGLHAQGWMTGIALGFLAWFVIRHVIFGFYTVDQNERAVVTSFGRAKRILGATTVYTPEGAGMRDSEKERYAYPQVEVVPPGGPYFRWPWQRVHKVSIATRTVNMAWDPEHRAANRNGTLLEAVTKDQLHVGLTGQIRFRVSEQNLYAYLFGVKNPPAHVMGFFISVLRERIATSSAAPRRHRRRRAATGLASDRTGASAISGISINDLRKNLRDLNEHMDRECASSAARYGILLDASLLTGIDPPADVESALAAINTAYNQVSSDISLAHASADQKIVQSRRAVEIETLRAQSEVEPLEAMARQLTELKAAGEGTLALYVRNVRLKLFGKARRAVVEVARG